MMKSSIATTIAATLALMLPIAPPKPKVDEKAYKSALDKIPDSKTKVDPWSNTR